ncbi:MAG: winged helix-turn-helix domain-containing protein, partial [bacterium]|nr:winged helix-turn-helix domain-containing protein [bacterium]
LQAKDFKDINRKAEAWWGWKPAKIALEHLFMEGTLMVVGRENFRKIYDLAERVLLPDTVTKIPTPLQSAEYLIQRAVRSMGIVSYKDIVYLRKDGVEKVKSLLERRVKSGVLQAVEIEGVNDTYYINKDDINRNVRESLVSGKEPVMRILSPFDNFVINRKRLKELFDFDYKLECFVPPGKRRFGYFSLPLLYKDGFIGIMDAKAERKEKRLIIKNLHLEQIPEKDFDMDTFSRLFSRELKAFMEFNGCSQLVVETGMLPDPLVGVFRCT